MKPKIFKPALLVMMALLIFNWPVRAQEAPAPPAMPQAPRFNDKDFAESMKKMALDMKDFALGMKDNFKDFGKDFSGSFSGMVPAIDLKDMDIDISGLMNLKNTRNGNATHIPAEERTKSYSKSYPVDADDELQIDNKYGKVTVNTWNRSEFKVDVQIKVSSGNGNDAQKYLDGISISDSKDGNVVSFASHFGQNIGQSGWSLWGSRNSRKVEVDYVIYMPSKNPLDITNRYGATVLPDFDGKVNITSAYGSFEAQALTHADNQIKVRYGSAGIESMVSGDINVAYGNLDIGTADMLDASISYGSAKISKIKGSANISARYSGSVKISELDKNFSGLSFNGSYSGIKVGMNNVSADFDITVHYGSFSFGDVPVEVTQKTPPDSHRGFSSTQNYKGHVGKGNGDKTIIIRSNYGSVQFE